MLYNILLTYGILSYVIIAVLIYYNNDWSNEWDSADLLMYMCAPVTIIIVLALLMKQQIPKPKETSYPSIFILAFIVLWCAFVWITKLAFG